VEGAGAGLLEVLQEVEEVPVHVELVFPAVEHDMRLVGIVVEYDPECSCRELLLLVRVHM
jgi:hypothetical protein